MSSPRRALPTFADARRLSNLRPKARHVIATSAVMSAGAIVTALAFAGPTNAQTTEPSSSVLAQRVDVSSVSRGQDRPSLDEQAVKQATARMAARHAASDRVATKATTRLTKASVKAIKKAAAQVDAAELGKTAGKRYTTSGLNVRTMPDADSTLRTVLDEGARVTITNRTEGGWRQVVLKGKSGWVLGKYLTSKKPTKPKKAESPKTTGGAVSTGACSKSASIESGLVANGVKTYRAICAAFPGVTSFGGARGGWGYHGTGQAVDVMLPNTTYGAQIAEWARAHASELGIIEVIYNHRIWTTQRAGDGWRGMSDRGSATANHEDHVHISVR